jgi:hypothetical protein
MSNPSASIKSADKHSPFSLRVVQTSAGVFFDVLDRADENNGRRHIITVQPQSARKLASWILDNVKEVS